MAEKKEKRYVSDNAQLISEWNWEKNVDFDPLELTTGSGKKVWWKCSNGHAWESTINNRNAGYGCPYCSGHKVLKGYNDLKTINPIIADEWNYLKNGNLNPENFTANSSKKVWWICNNSHEWVAAIYSRNAGSNCPYCAGQKVSKGENDLQTINPNLAKQWNYRKNGNLFPSDFTSKSDKKVWWICKKGHEWQATIANRNKGTGCPICKSERNTSFPEYAIVYYLRKHGLEAIHSYKRQDYELDVYIPSQKVAIEYDGYYWHKNKIEKDLQKNTWCKRDGIKLYRIREGLFPLNHYSIDYTIEKNQKDFPETLEKILFELTGTEIDINLKKDSIAIEQLREYSEKEKSLLMSNPMIASEWNYIKNGNLKPDFFLSNSNKKVWWVCDKGHEWQASIGERNNGRGCPYCSGRKVLAGYNDLQTINPFLGAEWNNEKNKKLTSIDVTSNSHIKAWWKCSKGHEWQATVSNRNKGIGCPYCSGRFAIKGENDLLTVNPVLAEEWNPEKNGNLKPEDFLANSGKKVWWKCSKGHEWQATIDNRSQGRGCPYCAHKKVIQGENDLQTVNPELAKEWNYEMNNGLTPADVLPNSGKKVWWKCDKGHEWQTRIQHRSNGHSCPECAKEKRRNKID